MHINSNCAFIAAMTVAGKWADLSGQSPDNRLVSADFIRSLLLGLPLSERTRAEIAEFQPTYAPFTETGRPFSIPVTSAGVRIRGAWIEGIIDLAGCLAPGGLGLPGLSLEQCRLIGLEGADVRDETSLRSLDISQSRLASLSLKDSMFSCLLARNAIIDGAVDISGARPLNGWKPRDWPGADMEAFCASVIHTTDTMLETGQCPEFVLPDTKAEPTDREDDTVLGVGDICWVDMFGSRIGAGMTAIGVKLRALPARPRNHIGVLTTRYSLRLEQIVMDGTLQAFGDSEFDGGLSINMADIRGDVWLGGARLTRGEGIALNAAGTRMRGFFAAGSPLRTVGELTLANARLDGDMDINRAQLDGDGGDAFNANGMHLEGEAALHSGFCARGSVRFEDARISGTLDMREARLSGEGRHALHASNLVVGASILLSKDFRSNGCIWLYGADIGGNLDLNGAAIHGSVAENFQEGLKADNSAPFINAVSGTDLAVGDSVLIGREFKALGSLRFQRARIEKDMGFVHTAIHEMGMEGSKRPDDAIDLGWTRVNGTLILEDNQLRGKINLKHASANLLSDNTAGYSGARDIDMDGFRYDGLYRCDLGHCSSQKAELTTDIVRTRIAWLDGARKYQPQPYINLARVLFEQGRPDAARLILIEKYNRDNQKLDKKQKVSPSAFSRVLDALSSNVTKIKAWITQVFSRIAAPLIRLSTGLYGALFGYGLDPTRAIATLIMSFIIGWGFFTFANTRGMMVVDQQAVAGSVKGAKPGAATGAKLGATIAEADTASEIPCGDAIRPSLYALDVFIPLIDLRQESKCEMGKSSTAPKLFEGFDISPGYVLFSEKEIYCYLKAIYALSGWLIISLSILTLSGILQRREL